MELERLYASLSPVKRPPHPWVASLAFALVLAPPKLPELFPKPPTYAYYIDGDSQRIDLKHPLPLHAFPCPPTPLEVVRGWWDAERGAIMVCDTEGQPIPLPGPYWVLVGRVEAISR